jgi:hypothetical protein
LRSVFALVLLPTLLRADEWLDLKGRYEVEWSNDQHRFATIYLDVAQRGRYRLGDWFQVGPDEKWLALNDGKKLQVFASDGKLILQSSEPITTFRFNRYVGRFAFATSKSIQVLYLDRPENTATIPLQGADWLQFVDGGIVARTGDRVVFVDLNAKVTTLVRGQPSVLAAASGRLAYAVGVTVMIIDIGRARSESLPSERSPITDVELSPDGRRLLLSTKDAIGERDTDGTMSVVQATNSQYLSFAPDGDRWVWSSGSEGAVVQGGGRIAQFKHCGRAVFRKTGADLVITGDMGVQDWNPATTQTTIVGEYSFPDADTESGDVIRDGSVWLYRPLDPAIKEQSAPNEPPPIPCRISLGSQP